MNLAGGIVIGIVFGVLAGACAFVIAYSEYKRNWSFHGSAWKMALRTAIVTFALFFLAGMLLPMVFRWVVPRN